MEQNINIFRHGESQMVEEIRNVLARSPRVLAGDAVGCAALLAIALLLLHLPVLA